MQKIKDFLSKIRSENWKITDHLFITLILGWIFFKYPLRFGTGIVRRLLVPLMTVENENLILLLIHYFGSIGIWLCILFFCLIFKRERHIITNSLQPDSGSSISYGLVGILAGFGMNALCILGASLSNSITYSFSGVNIIAFLFVFLGILIQSSAEELIFRGFVFGRIRQSYRYPIIAIISNSILFALIHIFNPGITILAIINLFLFGILMSCLTYLTNSIICAIGFHWIWNVTQTIIFGLPNSGNVSNFSIFTSQMVKSSFFFDNIFGIEGSWFCFLLFLIVIFVLFVFSRRYRRFFPEGR